MKKTKKDKHNFGGILKNMPSESMSAELMAAARTAISEVLAVKAGEKVLIVTNPEGDVSLISMALYDAALEVQAAPVLMYQQIKGQLDLAEDAVIGAIGMNPDVLISMSREKLGKDWRAIKEPYEINGKSYDNTFHYLLDGKRTLRAFWSPGVRVEEFVATVPVDYGRMKRECRVLADILDKALDIRITNPNGTDLLINIEGRKSFVDDGDFRSPGTGGNLPAGEAFISPVVGASEGMIVFDGSISVESGDIIIKEPIRAGVENGYVTSLKGGKEAEIFQETLRRGAEKAKSFDKEGKIPAGKGEEYARNTYHLGELGIGANPAAKISGNMLVDEKVYRTCHIAVGANYDEDAPALIHCDGLISAPTITARFSDGTTDTFLKEGVFNFGD
jgi:leucyl aminopeptidase (aminopeptidase T)